MSRIRLGKKTLILFSLFVFLMLSLSYLRCPPPAEEVMADFYRGGGPETGRTESMIANPLRENADIVKALVIEAISNKKMEYRRYAMGFLGECRINEAMPILLSILHDETEEDIFRGDALESLFLIDQKEGLLLAQIYQDLDDFLGYIAREILTGKSLWADPDNIISQCSNLEYQED